MSAPIEQKIFLANVNNRFNECKPYIYRWQTTTNQLIIRKHPCSYEKTSKDFVRIENIFPIQTLPFSQIQLQLSVLNPINGTFQSTLDTCPTTNCNETYIYRPNNIQTSFMDISLENVNELSILFLIDFNVLNVSALLIEMKSFNNLSFE